MRPRRWIPLVLIWVGILLLVQGGVSQGSGGTGVVVLGQRRDLGVLTAGGSVAPASWATGVGRGCAVAVQCGEKGRLRCPLFGGLVDRISE